MKKLNLNLDDLQVESFTTTPESSGSRLGTVFGYQQTFEIISCVVTCGNFSCDPSCDGTCDASCNGTCPGQNTCDLSCGGTCGDTCNGCDEPSVCIACTDPSCPQIVCC